jgi:hypothetical protein
MSMAIQAILCIADLPGSPGDFCRPEWHDIYENSWRREILRLTCLDGVYWCIGERAHGSGDETNDHMLV